MEKGMIQLEQRRIERLLIQISLQTEAASELLQEAQETASCAQALLMAAQQEAHGLYAFANGEKK